MASLLISLVLGAAPAARADTVVVCPAVFETSLQPWLEYRAAQGHEIQMVPAELPIHEIRDRIRTSSGSGRLKHVLLIGDAEPLAKTRGDNRRRCTPTHHVKAKVNVHWGSEPEIATDAPFADLDNDGLPDVALGRIPADSAQELTAVIGKIMAYERKHSLGMWRRRINFVAGVGGFGTIADAVLEMATKRFLTDGIPAGYQTSMTYGSWQSPYCPDPRMFHDITLRRLNEGCLFWVYIGHGQKRYLDHVRTPGGAYHIFDTDDVKKLRSAAGSPIAIFLACYTGAFDQPSDCLAEEMLRSPGGPTAIVCGSRVTMPYAMAVMSHAMLDEYFQKRPLTLGEVLLRAKQRMASEAPDDENRQLLDAIASAISPAKDMLKEERLEHLSLFHLIGDPLMRVHHPETILLEADESVVAGKLLRIRGKCELSGQGVIELACRRDRTKTPPPRRDRFHLDDRFLQSFNGEYEKANDTVWLSQPIHCKSGALDITLTVPSQTRGPCHVRVYLSNDDSFAIGSHKVFIRRPRSN